MTRWLVLALVLATAASCTKKLPWGDKKATELVAGPYKFTIPPGWRDLSELQDDDIKSKLPAGVVGIMPEKLGDKGFQANIVMNYAPFPADTPVPGCDEFANEVAKSFGVKATNVETIKIENDPGCRWSVVKESTVGIQVVRFDGGHELVIQCLRAGEGDPDADRTCNSVLDSLHVPRSTVH